MMQNTRNLILAFSFLSLFGLNLKAQDSSPASVITTNAGELNDVIAKVDDQPITYAELNTLLNSSAIVGLSVPALGTPERNRVRITLLDKAISNDLLYLDALKQGVDQDPGYRQDLQRFSDGVLSSLYRQKYLIGEIEVTDAEIQAQFERSSLAGQALTDELKLGIEAAIRKARFKARTATLRERLREGVSVVIEEENLDPHGDETRGDEVVVARIDGAPVFWKDIEGLLQT
ncbi:MAG: hypothetical protein PVG22_13215, partial [Chromatiales bacterium]